MAGGGASHPAAAAPGIDRIVLYRRLPTSARLDVWPFAFLLHPVALAIFVAHPIKAVGGLIIGVSIILHILCALFEIWLINFRAWCTLRSVTSVSDAECVKVIPVKYAGATEIVPLLKAKTEKSSVAFDYRRQHFWYDEDKNAFRELDYPVNETIGFYLKSRGLKKSEDAAIAAETYGENKFDIPLPTFQELMIGQMLAPFFVFQVFCVALWCLDEYWYYSLFTLGMLIIFESTVVHSRLRSLTELRKLPPKGDPVYVYRGVKWERKPPEELLPGDLVSLTHRYHPSSSGGDDHSGEGRVIPADVLLLYGKCITNEAMLTGESTPQWKIPASERQLSDALCVKTDKRNIVFGGTAILQSEGDKTAPLKTPDNGCLAFVLRTGFETQQGQLMRTILFSTERVTANNLETGLFILFLLFFAIIASGYVLYKGLQDPERSIYKLILDCSLILTSVIPPELPMELSIAVNASLISLIKLGIYCTEPFRIPFGGKVDVCCFDKTGTLTSDDLKLQGISYAASAKSREDAESKAQPSEECDNGTTAGGETDFAIVPANESGVNTETKLVLGACHALVNVEGKLVGDPIEKAAISGIGWSFNASQGLAYSWKEKPKDKLLKEPREVKRKKGSSAQESKERVSAQILHRFHFSSSLKRMSVVAKVDRTNETSKLCVLSKGAAEVMKNRFLSVPTDFDQTHKYFARQGARVIALGYKAIDPELTVSQVKEIPRDEIESGLEYAGLAVFSCPMKRDSDVALQSLKESNHHLVMLTGDHVLTAVHVASKLHIVNPGEKPVLFLCQSSTVENDHGDLVQNDSTSSSKWEWSTIDETTKRPYEGIDSSIQLGRQHDLCVDGAGLSFLEREVAALGRSYLQGLLGCIKVYARMDPAQKERVLTAIRESGHVTLMCGDGTNDVGALKQAHIGVALLNAPPSKSALRQKKKQRDMIKEQIAMMTGENRPNLSPAMRKKIKDMAAYQEKLEKILEESQDMGEAPVVRLGDASMAAAFTARESSVMCCAHILRQGRSTLVTTLQMFKILGLNCLSSAYSLSVMYLDGVKLGDTQATIGGMFSAALFLFLSQTKPQENLSAQRPHASIFNAYVLLTILGQSLVHLLFLAFSVAGAKMHMGEDEALPAKDSDFEPNIVNTVAYTVGMLIQVATFTINYSGAPFNTPLRENKPFYFALMGGACFFWVLTAELLPDWNESLQLVPVPLEFRSMLLLMGALDFGLCWLIEQALKSVFRPKPVKFV